jgi:SAM-dependent methyltransferase
MSLKSLFSGLLRPASERNRDWPRYVMYEKCGAYIDTMSPENLDVLEVSGGAFWEKFKFKSFIQTSYPDFDICTDTLDDRFDLIISDQVFGHLLRPWNAARNVHEMLRPGGTFLITTSFMIKLAPHPEDCTRWSETGLKYFLEDAGFDFDSIETGAWGNRDCIKANFDRWAKLGRFGTLHNEWKFPVTVWAMARKSD